MTKKQGKGVLPSTPRMRVEIGGVPFKNPVMTASGTFAYGIEFAHLMDLQSIGGVVVKGVSMKPIKGNPPPRIYETAAGMLNAIGWQNIGAIEFVTKKLPALRKLDTNVIVNVVGFALDDYLEVTRFLNDCAGCLQSNGKHQEGVTPPSSLGEAFSQCDQYSRIRPRL